MDIVFENNFLKEPKVSIILLDWSVRESFHSLNYLNSQTVSRDMYEIIWIEYYRRRSPEIKEKLKEYERLGKPPLIDKWIVMEMPENVYYHKHLMYNLGIITSKGEIVAFCDSDAMFRTTYVESIINTFNENKNIVLHIDEVRSKARKYYPFNSPSFEDILNNECMNWKDGKTAGLLDEVDPLHSLNYGACMCALREDLIKIGGADEHIDYLGHICGPYEMTFRFVNSGKREVWHQDEFIYHTWHPGTDGKDNYLGPHDNLNMSQTALSARRTKRILPLAENPAIKSLRQKKDVSYDDLLSMAVSAANLKGWMIDGQYSGEDKDTVGGISINLKDVNKNKTVMDLAMLSKNLLFALRLYGVFIKILISYGRTKIPFIKEKLKEFFGLGNKKDSTDPAVVFANPKAKVSGVADFFRLGFKFLKYLMNWPNYVIDRCWRCLHDLTTMSIHKVVLFGTGNVAKVLCILSGIVPVRITAIYDNPVRKKRFMGYEILPIESIRDYKGKIIIASFEDILKSAETLKKLGVNDDMIIDLW